MTPVRHSVPPITGVLTHASGWNRKISIYLVDLPPAAQTAAQAAGPLAFPQADVLTVASVEAIKPALKTLSVVVISEKDSGALTSTVPEVGGALRWPLVVLGDSSPMGEPVPPSEWNAPLLARVFRAALAEHESQREIARLRGDLKTVARRVSHDLRTPVGCIYTSSDVLREPPPDDAAFVTSMAGIIKDSAGEISDLVDRVSFILKASVDAAISTKVDLGPVILAVLERLEPEIQKSSATIHQPPAWPEIVGVASWLQVIFHNLLLNALQHGGARPQIRITWNETEVGVRFAVTDSGAGVAAPKLGALFASFEQLHALHVQGLGLSIVRRLVELHHGIYGYEKLSEGGACFHFILPPPDA